jgi:hypothetical protein
MKEKVFTVTIADCEVQTFRSGGKGGQNQNKVESGVRIIHRPSGAVGESREHRSQLQNKRAAFARMAETDKFQAYVNRVVYYSGKSPEERVDADMRPSKLKVEYRIDGQWTVQDAISERSSGRSD